MEKISMNDVIAFIKKAMKNNLKIESRYGDSIYIKSGNKSISIGLINNIITGNPLDFIYISGNNGKTKVDIQDESELLRYKLVMQEVKSYINGKGIEDFYTFFVEKIDFKPTTINDLDNEDD